MTQVAKTLSPSIYSLITHTLPQLWLKFCLCSIGLTQTTSSHSKFHHACSTQDCLPCNLPFDLLGAWRVERGERRPSGRQKERNMSVLLQANWRLLFCFFLDTCPKKSHMGKEKEKEHGKKAGQPSLCHVSLFQTCQKQETSLPLFKNTLFPAVCCQDDRLQVFCPLLSPLGYLSFVHPVWSLGRSCPNFFLTESNPILLSLYLPLTPTHKSYFTYLFFVVAVAVVSRSSELLLMLLLCLNSPII